MKSQAWCRAVAALSATVLLAPSSAFGGGFGIRIDLPQIPAAPHIPTPGEINKAATKAVDSAGQAVGQVSTNAAKEAGIGLGNVAREAQIGAGNVAREGQIGAGNVAREAQIGAGNVATTIRKAGSDTGRQLNRSQHDLEDAGTAIYRFSVNEARGTQASINHAEERFRQGKVVDAFFHLATEHLQNTDKDAAQAAQESSLLSTVGSVAATVYGGPGGAAAYAAWLTYHQTGDINLAIRVGIIAGVSSYANSQATTMETGTLTDSIKRAAVVGAIGGAGVAAAGGDPNAINQAFLRGGAAILVQDGYKAYVSRDFVKELGPATGPAMCMSAPVSGATDGCPRPTDFMKDDQGRLIMTDKDGGFHHVDVGKENDVPQDWRPVGNASSTPPGTPVVGIQTDRLPPLSQANEGSATMVALAKVPGMNAMALFHDRWAVAWEMNPMVTKVSIVPAIVVTYMGATAVVDNASTTSITDAAARASRQSSSAGPAAGSAGRASSAVTTDSSDTLAAVPQDRTHASGTEGGIPVKGPFPPTIRAVKPAKAPLETLICTRHGSIRVSSVIPGKQRGDLQCMVYTETNGKASATYISKNIPGYCAEKLFVMGDAMTREGWKCEGR